MARDEMMHKIAEDLSLIPSNYGSLQYRRDAAKRALRVLGLLDGTNMLIRKSIDAQTLAEVLKIARQAPSVEDRRVAAEAATLAGAGPKTMQVAVEIGAEMARDFRYIVSALSS